MSYTVHVLQNGFSTMQNEAMLANCSCTLIKGPTNIIVDTMTAWDRSIVEEGVASHGLNCDDIGYAIATHGHSDHLGNLNLFLKAKHIVGFTISYQHEFFIHPFETGEPYKIDENVEVLPTPGHTTADVSVVVRTQDMGTVVVAELHAELHSCHEDEYPGDPILQASELEPFEEDSNSEEVISSENDCVAPEPTSLRPSRKTAPSSRDQVRSLALKRLL
ncbi:metallo-beta-lactamase domain-containing protein 1-like isoform X2 [Oratosquilla oratoria]|uniref:metallo-beta-lactamase domain-containing protein 1-like isoform X2 n=1 Tax=Oratosquilla oratoria TaxID=337810 RepID=UPI003F76B995